VWLRECFGEVIAKCQTERNHRFLEEALELVQSLDCTQSEARQLVDYVFTRPIGEPHQECGGVMITLAALCYAAQLDMNAAGETELARIWEKIEKIRAKQAAKPKHSPLPEAAAPAAPPLLVRCRPKTDSDTPAATETPSEPLQRNAWEYAKTEGLPKEAAFFIRKLCLRIGELKEYRK
jgi:hypothetical protein